MKKFLLTIILTFAGWTGFAQSDTNIISGERSIGKNSLTQKDIVAREFVFPERIYDTYIDTLHHCVTVQLRGMETDKKKRSWFHNSGTVMLYDFSNNRIKWSKPINYVTGDISQYDNVIVQTDGEKSYCLNYETGNDLWEVKNAISYVEPDLHVGIGYKKTGAFRDTPSNTLEGIDLTTGSVLWKRELNREYGWNGIFHSTDSTLIIVAAGLHEVNINTGKGWDYTTVTGDEDYTASAAGAAVGTVAGVALGVLTGMFVIPIGYGSDLVRDVASNVWADSLNFYFASRERLACLGHDGEVKWMNFLPNDMTSKSYIFIKDGVLYMINRGFAYMGARKLGYGTPFIAKFNRKTGERFYLSKVGERKEQMNGFDIEEDTLFVLFKDRISKYSLYNGSLIAEQTFDVKTYGGLNGFVGSQVYIKTDSAYQNMLLSDTTRCYVTTGNGKILTLDDKLNVVGQTDFDQLYIHYLNYHGYRFIAKDDRTIVIDENGREVTNMNISRKTDIIGSKLYNIQEKSIVEVDLADVLGTR